MKLKVNKFYETNAGFTIKILNGTSGFYSGLVEDPEADLDGEILEYSEDGICVMMYSFLDNAYHIIREINEEK